MAAKERLSLNQTTTERWSLREAVDGCVRHGIPSISIWRHKLQEVGLSETARMVKEAGLHVSSVCRGGGFPAPTAAERKARLEDNYRAVDEAAELSADSLVIVVGPPNGTALADARNMAEDGVAALAPYAKQRRVRLGLEPLHPMFAANRCVLNTLQQAIELAQKHDPDTVGIIVDAYHVWWDPQLYCMLARAGKRIFGFHVSDWIFPLPDLVLGRGMMGDGVIDIAEIRKAVDAAGYAGPIEVEILNQKIWDMPGDELLPLMIERFVAHV